MTRCALWFDATLYPDVDPPATLDTLACRVDFLARLCAAWDFGVLPRLETADEIQKADWRDAVDSCRLLTSPAYHLLRTWHSLPPLTYLGRRLAYITEDPELEHV